MRKIISLAIAALALGAAAPAMAASSGGYMSMQRALDVASDMGLATISHTQFAGDEWQVQGYDVPGRYMEVDVDVNTGEVLNVDR